MREWNEQIIFLRKIIPGGADKSYGIQVARLAGLPKEILDRAKDILTHLEKPNGASNDGANGRAAGRRPKRCPKRRSHSWTCCHENFRGPQGQQIGACERADALARLR